MADLERWSDSTDAPEALRAEGSETKTSKKLTRRLTTAAVTGIAMFAPVAAAEAHSPNNLRASYDATIDLIKKTPVTPGTERGRQPISFQSFYDLAAECVYWQPLRVFPSRPTAGAVRIAVNANDSHPSKLSLAVDLDKHYTSPSSSAVSILDDAAFDPMSGERLLDKTNTFTANYSCDDVTNRKMTAGVFTKTAKGELKPFFVKRGGKKVQLTAPVKGLQDVPTPVDKASFTSQKQHEDEDARRRSDGPARGYADINIGSRGLKEIRNKNLVIAVGAYAALRTPYLGKDKPLAQSPMVGYFMPSRSKARQTLRTDDKATRNIKKFPSRSRLIRMISTK